MNSRVRPDAKFASEQANRMHTLLRERATLTQDDLEYVMESAAKLKDERLKSCIAELIGWGDEERAEMETFVAIAIEVLKTTNVSKIRDAARTVELRLLMKELK